MQPNSSNECLRRRMQRVRRATCNVAAVAAAIFVALPAGAATLDRIKDTGHIRFGFMRDAPPFSISPTAMPCLSARAWRRHSSAIWRYPA